MDISAQNRWNSKLEQHRRIRRENYPVWATSPSNLFNKVAEYNGSLIHNWMEIFEKSWLRESPVNPEASAKNARDEIIRIIDSEKELIIKEIGELPLRLDRVEIKREQQQLIESCRVLGDKCIELVESLKAYRLSEIDIGRKARKANVLTNVISLLIGIFLTWFGVWLNDRYREKDRPLLLVSAIDCQLDPNSPGSITFRLKNAGRVAGKIVRHRIVMGKSQGLPPKTKKFLAHYQYAPNNLYDHKFQSLFSEGDLLVKAVLPLEKADIEHIMSKNPVSVMLEEDYCEVRRSNPKCFTLHLTHVLYWDGAVLHKEVSKQLDIIGIEKREGLNVLNAMVSR